MVKKGARPAEVGALASVFEKSASELKQQKLLKCKQTIQIATFIRDVALKTCHMRWTIGKSGERGPGISVLVARHDDDDDDIPYKLACLMFSTSQTTTHFHFVFDLTILQRAGTNLSIFPFSHRLTGLPRASLRSLRYNSTTEWVNQFSVNFVACLAQRNFCFLQSRSSPSNRITSLRMCSYNDTPCLNLSLEFCVITSLYSSFLVVYHVLLAYTIAKECYWKDWLVGSSPDLPETLLLS